MSATRRHPSPAPITQRGMTHAVEIAPGTGDFRIQAAGKRIGLLFREELLQRQALRAMAKKEASRA